MTEFMASVTCGLTAEDRDQLQILRSFRVWDYAGLPVVLSTNSLSSVRYEVDAAVF